MARFLHLLSVATLGGQVLAGVGGAAFYGYIIWSMTSGSGKLGLGGFVVAGAMIMGTACAGFASVTLGVFVAALRRAKVSRFLAPIPPLVATVGFGGWLASGDPGDEHWLRIVVAVEAVVLVIALAAMIVGDAPATDSALD